MSIHSEPSSVVNTSPSLAGQSARAAGLVLGRSHTGVTVGTNTALEVDVVEIDSMLDVEVVSMTGDGVGVGVGSWVVEVEVLSGHKPVKRVRIHCATGYVDSSSGRTKIKGNNSDLGSTQD